VSGTPSVSVSDVDVERPPTPRRRVPRVKIGVRMVCEPVVLLPGASPCDQWCRPRRCEERR
jgi:hypothetical protein